MQKLEESTEDIREDQRREVRTFSSYSIFPVIWRGNVQSKECTIYIENFTYAHEKHQFLFMYLY